MEPQSTYRAALGRTARTEHLAGVDCHCTASEQGETPHPLGTPGCASTVKVGTYSQASPRSGAWTTAADIYAELARIAPSKEARAHWKGRAAIAQSANREWSAQDARTSQRQREIRERNLPKPRAA